MNVAIARETAVVHSHAVCKHGPRALPRAVEVLLPAAAHAAKLLSGHTAIPTC